MSNPPSSQSPQDLPGKGLFGWLGRQIAHVKQALHTDVTQPAPKTIYRDTKVEEVPHPTDPKVKLRRTVIDEAVVDPREESESDRREREEA